MADMRRLRTLCCRWVTIIAFGCSIIRMTTRFCGHTKTSTLVELWATKLMFLRSHVSAPSAYTLHTSPMRESAHGARELTALNPNATLSVSWKPTRQDSLVAQKSAPQAPALIHVNVWLVYIPTLATVRLTTTRSTPRSHMQSKSISMSTWTQTNGISILQKSRRLWAKAHALSRSCSP